MSSPRSSPGTRPPGVLQAALSGGLCLAILIGMLVSHAWPLWTGETILLRVRPVDPRDLFRGDYVRLGYDLNRLQISGPGEAPSAAPEAEPPDDAARRVRPLGGWWDELLATSGAEQEALLRRLRDRVFYVQLEREPAPDGDAPAVYRAVSLSDGPQEGQVNLQGRLRWAQPPYGEQDAWRFDLHYGIDALYVQERTGLDIEEAIRRGEEVLAEIAVTRSGRARLRDLIVGQERLGND